MVFIEGVRGNVLFTGDFRLPLNCASRLAFFKDTKSSVSSQELALTKSPASKKKPQSEYRSKQVENLYVDMTFFKPDIKYIPTREESVQVLVKFIKDFISTNDYVNNGYHKNLVYMKTSARIGLLFEYIFINIL